MDKEIKDVAVIPTILRDKESLKNDRNGRKFKTYIGKRGKKKERLWWCSVT